MASNNKNKSAADAVYSEEFRARVNREGSHNEVILSNSPTNIVLRNVKGVTNWENGATYTVTVTKTESDTAAATEDASASE